ncbi:chitobiase/beta-hexosaminidase C-terminal domain-containing protein [Luteolibacter arcticus]|uniref:Chitobiase/beta-hexosaminidase C-terminal domain-containing protein n=1 Tax=Luteolibacter arcticus TaxID=1581411 RepID=A0ABT3GLU4_9BACT|nr:LamG-like jellyroll fold domain-containing protein [Luteolibacter arcticus]MCW1924480.1 chitobiase/beta-hexosaminidase C-terminal domain-containing protein [Luteolibacter arcticus]
MKRRPFTLPGSIALIVAAQCVSSVSWGEIEAPVFSPSPGDFSVGLDVAITAPTPGSEVHYTLNGAEPTRFDPVIVSGSAIRISRTSNLKAKAWVGVDPSNVSESTFRITGSISCGYQHGLAMSVAGRLWSWGEQGSGRLGNANTASADVVSPAQVLLNQTPVYFDMGSRIAAGYDHSVALDQQGNVWAFGENGDGQLGNNATADSGLPVRVLESTTAGDYLEGCVGIDVGQIFSVALLSSGIPVAWGSQASGRLGNGVTSSNARKYAAVVMNGDVAGYPALSGIRQVDAGYGHAMAREPNAVEAAGGLGRVWVWGRNHVGQLGRGDTNQISRAYPMLLAANTVLTDAIDASGGGAHTSVVRWKDGDSNLEGTVWSCGSREFGRLGNGSTSSGDVLYPVKAKKVGNTDLTGVVQVSAGPSHTLAVDRQGHVWAWGNNQYGQLGDGTITHSGYALMVKNTAGTGVLENIVMVSAGGESTSGRSMALAADGTIYVWGRNDDGQLGNGQTANATTLPMAHTHNNVSEGAPSLAMEVEVTAPNSPGKAVVDFAPAHSAPGGVGNIDHVVAYLDGAVAGTLSGPPWTVSVDSLGYGSHQVYGIATDNEGNTAMSPSVRFTIGDLTGDPSMDEDGDGLTNARELQLNSDPNDDDSDDDGMEDGFEEAYFTPQAIMDPGTQLPQYGPAGNLDGDSMNNLDECDAGTLPNNYNEQFSITTAQARWFGVKGTYYQLQWAPFLFGPWKGFEPFRVGANAWIEIKMDDLYYTRTGYWRMEYFSLHDDVTWDDDWDGDGMETWWEIDHGFAYGPPDGLTTINGAGGDPDGDGLTNIQEWNLRAQGFSPRMRDSDGDGYSDSIALGLAGYWKLDDGSGVNAIDSSGLYRNALLVPAPGNGGAPDLSTEVGMRSGALSFVASDDAHLSIPDGSLTPVLDGTTDATVSLWFTSTAPISAGYSRALLSATGAGNLPTWTITLERLVGGQLLLKSTAPGGSGEWPLAWPVDAASGDWHHVVVVRHAGGYRARLDGISLDDASVTTALGALDVTSLCLGRAHDGAGSFIAGSGWLGAMDEVRIYRRAIESAYLNDLFAPNDSDRDGLPDLWENKWFGNLSQTGSDDSDLDGVNNFAEFMAGSPPGDFYNGQIPTVTVIEGAPQEVVRGDVSRKIVFEVTVPSKTHPYPARDRVAGAPVSLKALAVTANVKPGRLSEDPEGADSTSRKILTTGSDGRVTVYFIAPR